MEISGNSQPVGFYTKNTGNTINMAINEDNSLYPRNIFAPEFMTETIKKNASLPKKRRKSKRLNTLDSDYLPDEVEEVTETKEDSNNFFVKEETNTINKNIQKAWEHFLTSTPLINYFFMQRKKNNIQKAVETLNNISQNVDELLNTAVPYGEAATVYTDVAKNLTDAANIIGKTNKEV